MIYGLTMIAAAVLGGGAVPARTPIDGTYELTRRLLADGTAVRPPALRGIYTMARGRFSLNLFFHNRDGTLASESTIGRFTFSPTRYCEWIEVTTHNNLGHPGVTNDVPTLASHCAPVRRLHGRFVFVAPGENVTASYGRSGFTARIDNGDTDFWTKIAP